MTPRYVLALDQGTTSSKAFLVDKEGSAYSSSKQKYEQIYPQPGWVEHRPQEIWESQLNAMNQLVDKYQLSAQDVAAIGIANQRETVIVWNKETGEPVFNAIVWQCRRTADLVEQVCGSPEITALIEAKTGLHPDAYFSASKIRWILDEIEGGQQMAEEGKLLFGTVDSWLVYKLTGGKVHATDYTNASRTMLFDIHACQWDEELFKLWNIPLSMAPQARPSAGDFGVVAQGPLAGVPIAGVVGDQQAALFGQCCFESGEAKSTYGTGCFLLMHTGNQCCVSHNNLVSTIAASAPGTTQVEYALEGSVYSCATLIQWVRDALGFIRKSARIEPLAKSVEDTDGVYIVPAFTGLGAPYWDAEVRGAILGITRGTTSAHLSRAALEAVAYQAYDLVKAMESDAGFALSSLNVDGGVAANNFCMQFQSDVLDIQVRRPQNVETTALGSGFLAGLAVGFWKDTAELKALRSTDDVFNPKMDNSKVQGLLEGWHKAVNTILTK